MDDKSYDLYKNEVDTYVRCNVMSIHGWITMSEEDRQHIIDIALSICLHRDGIQKGGGFVTAVLENDLTKAVTKADTVCSKALKVFIFVRDYCYPTV